MLDRDNSRDPVPPLGRAFYPEQGDLGLLGGARGAIDATEALHLVEIGRVLLAAHCVRLLRPVLRAGAEHERSDLSPTCKSRERRVPRDELEISRVGPWDVAEIKEGRSVCPLRVPQIADGWGGG